MRQQKTEERIQKALNRGDDFHLEKLNEFLRKQEIAENIRKKFAEEREEKAKQQEMIRKEKKIMIISKIKINI